MPEPIAIIAVASVSPLGSTAEEIWDNYLHSRHSITEKKIGDSTALAASLSDENREAITRLRAEHSDYKNLDDSVLFAIAASRGAIQKADWKAGDDFGINIGSSRGATSLFERYHEDYLKQHKTGTLASPTTTLGNISSWVAHDLQSNGPEISHSITCSTALHALLNGVAWLRSGLADKFLVGGSEAALTPFTIAQMQALRIYAKSKPVFSFHEDPELAGSELYEYPCRAFDLEKKQNTMVLGEGAAMACITSGRPENALAFIRGIGYATEMLEHSVSISAGAACLQKSMTMALSNVAPEEVDVVIMHAPGTLKGDRSEYNAIRKVFGSRLPALTSNKWKLGHTFGASGMLSVELAVLMLQHREFIPIPFIPQQKIPEKINTILVNAVGFGGNAVSVLLGR